VNRTLERLLVIPVTSNLKPQVSLVNIIIELYINTTAIRRIELSVNLVTAAAYLTLLITGHCYDIR